MNPTRAPSDGHRKSLSFRPNRIALMGAMVSATIVVSSMLPTAVADPVPTGPPYPGEVANGLIAFSKSYDIFTMHEAGDRPVAIATGGSPAWRGDGNRLAMNKGVGRNGDAVIVTMDAAGADKERVPTVPSNAYLNFHPTWAPGGHRLAITRCGGGTDCPDGYAITIIRRRDGVPLLALPYDHKFDAAPAWSPDGSVIAFERCCFHDPDSTPFDSGTTELFLWYLADDSVSRLTNNRHNDGAPSWSPDGSTLVFQHGGGDSGSVPFGGWTEDPRLGSIRVLVLSSGERRTLTTGADDFDPAYSPDGERIVFGRCPAPGVEDSCDLYTMNVDGAGLLRLTHSRRTERDPAWQPIPSY